VSDTIQINKKNLGEAIELYNELIVKDLKLKISRTAIFLIFFYVLTVIFLIICNLSPNISTIIGSSLLEFSSVVAGITKIKETYNKLRKDKRILTSSYATLKITYVLAGDNQEYLKEIDSALREYLKKFI